MTDATPGPKQSRDTIANDLLHGADQIAHFIFGSEAERRKVYHLAGSSRIPIFRLGAVLCARRSVLLDWIAIQEQRGQRFR